MGSLHEAAAALCLEMSVSVEYLTDMKGIHPLGGGKFFLLVLSLFSVKLKENNHFLNSNHHKG